MSNRINQEREAELQPKRMQTAIEELNKLGFKLFVTETEISFVYNHYIVHFWPYSGWHSGSTIKDGRGLNKLLKQLK